MPIPSDIHQMAKFSEAIEHAISRKHWVAIYPEAHIWPYYNKIRPFGSVSFRYPVTSNAPVFAYTMTFQKRKHSNKPKITVFVDGPFFPDTTLPKKAAANKLRDEVYAAMTKRAEEYSTYEYKYKYVYREKGNESDEREVVQCEPRPEFTEAADSAQTDCPVRGEAVANQTA
jgi:hypothetical protein